MHKSTYNTEDDYDIGYGKPPKSNQFKKGQSGNPNGRPKGSMNLQSMIKHIFEAKVVVTENGKRIHKSKLEISITQIANKAASGDLKATQMMLHLFPMMDAAYEEKAITPDLVADREHAKKIMARLTKAAFNQLPENQHDHD